MRIQVPFGQGELAFTVPDKYVVDHIKSNPVRIPGDPAAEIARALERPIGAPRLREMTGPGRRVAVICEDITRITPTVEIVRQVLAEIHAGGASQKDVFIVMALGTHRNMTREEMAVKLGEGVLRDYPVFNSEFSGKQGLVYAGEMEGKVPLWVDRRVMEADVRVGVGSIVPHPAAGFSGGGKIMIPGVTGEETVAAFHHAYGEHKEFMFGREDSPIRQYMEAMVGKIGLHFIVNAVATPEKKIYKVVAGHFIKAHRAGVRFAREVFCVRVNTRPDIAVLNAFPAESDFWQATKAYMSSVIVKPGGTALLLAPCPEGLGPHPRYAEYIGMSDDPEWRRANIGTLPVEERIPLSGGRTLARLRRSVRLAVYSPGLNPRDMDTARIEYTGNIGDYIAQRLSACGPRARVSVVHYGGEISAYV
jgi:nickel-dependent lactate racemase